MQCGVVPTPAAVAAGKDSDDLMEGTVDDGPVEEDIEFWENGNEDAEEVTSNESGQMADDNPDVGKGPWM